MISICGKACLEYTVSWKRGNVHPELSTYGYPPVRAQMGLRGTKVFNIKLFLTNSLVEANVNGKVAMAFRQYDKADGMIGIYTQAGKATFKNIHIYQPVD